MPIPYRQQNGAKTLTGFQAWLALKTSGICDQQHGSN